jgi:hypothetical protein
VLTTGSPTNILPQAKQKDIARYIALTTNNSLFEHVKMNWRENILIFPMEINSKKYSNKVLRLISFGLPVLQPNQNGDEREGGSQTPRC